MNNYGIHLAPVHQYKPTEDIVRLLTSGVEITKSGVYLISQDSGVAFFRVTNASDNITPDNTNAFSLCDDTWMILYLEAGQHVKSNVNRGTCIRLEPV